MKLQNRFPTTAAAQGSFPAPTEGRTGDTFAVPEITTTVPTTAPPTTTTGTTTPPTTTTTSLCLKVIQGDVLFDTDQWALKDTAATALSDLATEIQQETENPELRIVGHTDSRGSDAYNDDLSEKRAKAVFEWFAANGFDRSRMTYEGKGESGPKVPDRDADGNFLPNSGAVNRRVEIFVSSTEACP